MILMYHHVSPLSERPNSPPPREGWEYALTPAQLSFHLSELHRRGFRFVSLGEMVGAIRATGRQLAGTVAITFDDGWADNYHHAFPVLRQRSVPATFFVTTRHISDGVNDPKKMTVAQLQELCAAGMSIGGHTRNHLDLTTLPDSQIVDEVAGSKADLEGVLDAPVELFAYPGGCFTSRTAEIVRSAGFSASCSVFSWGRSDRDSLFWMYRDTFSEDLGTLRDRMTLSPSIRRAMWHVRHRWLLKRQLRGVD